MRLPYLHAVIIGRAVYPASQVPFRVCREPFPTSMIYSVYRSKKFLSKWTTLSKDFSQMHP